MAAASHNMDLCKGLEDEADFARELTDSGMLQPHMHNVLLDAVVTDPVLQDRQDCTALRAAHPGLQPNGFDNKWHWRNLKMHFLIKWMYHHASATAPHAARRQHVILRNMTVMRGSGLVASPYGLAHARNVVRDLVHACANKDIAQCIRERRVLCTLQLQTIETAPSADSAVDAQSAAAQREAARLTGAHQERYAACPKLWEYRHILSMPGALIPGSGPTLAEVKRELRRRRANCLPAMLDWSVTEEFQMSMVVKQRFKIRQPQRYEEVGGWPPEEVPPIVQGKIVSSSDDFSKATFDHAFHIVTEQDAAVRRAAPQAKLPPGEGSAPRYQATSLPLEALAQS